MVAGRVTDAARAAAIREPNAAIGARIREIRQRRRRSQEWLAAELGITFQQVQKYEKGTNRVAACTLASIATALEADVADFYPPTPGRPGLVDVVALEDTIVKLAGTCATMIDTAAAMRDELLAAAERLLAERLAATEADDVPLADAA